MIIRIFEIVLREEFALLMQTFSESQKLVSQYSPTSVTASLSFHSFGQSKRLWTVSLFFFQGKDWGKQALRKVLQRSFHYVNFVLREEFVLLLKTFSRIDPLERRRRREAVLL